MTQPSILPMLAETATQADIPRLIGPEWAFTVKVDGVRLLVRRSDMQTVGFSRSGRVTTVPDGVRADFERLGEQDVVVDGELLGDTLIAFDLVIPGLTWRQRQNRLRKAYATWKPEHVRLMPAAVRKQHKLAMLRRVQEGKGEGLVIKKVSSLYEPGTRSRAWLKFKMTKDLDLVVTDWHRDGKQNLVVSLYRGDELVEVGEVGALTGDGPKIRVGDTVSVKVLYVSDNDRLVQPTMPRRRTHEKEARECTWDQLAPLKTNKNLILDWDVCA